MYSLTLSRAQHTKQRDVVPGLVVDLEGCALVSVIDAGIEKVKKSNGDLNEKFAGFATAHNVLPSNEALSLTATIPAIGPFTVQLRFGNLTPTQIRIYDTTAPIPLTEGNPANPAEYSAVDASGLLTFNAAQAGHSITIWLKRDLTIQQAQQIREAAGTGGVTHVNNYAPAYFSKIGVAHGECELFTDQYDVTKDFGAPGAVVKTGLAGLFTIGGNGDAANFVVIQVPGPTSPLLGLRFIA